MKRSLLGLQEEELKAWAIQEGEKPFRAKQILQWVYAKGVTDPSKMTDLNQALQAKLDTAFSPDNLQLERTQDSCDGETTKFLWRLKDDQFVESVLIRAPDRRTVCVSSQIGCPARCAFCASGRNGWIRNLEVAEIVEQVYRTEWLLQKNGERVSHVVFMGMGEPMENYDNVVKAIRLLSSPTGLNLSQRRITVSTVGLIEGILRLADEGLKINLVLSLHAPNQKLRQKIIPYARKYGLEEILQAMREFAKKTKRDITYEYTLLKGINDGLEQAKELADLLKREQCTINLIPYNPVEGLHLARPAKETIEEFRQTLVDAGLNTTWRYTKGKDIAAACGQLALQRTSAALSLAN